MSDASDQHPDQQRHLRRWPDDRRTPDDLELLRSHPSLATLAGRGRQFDRLPVASTAWAFAAATGTSLLAYGYLGAVLPVVGTVVALALTASALLQRDIAAARTVLRITLLGLLGWMLLSAFVLSPHPSTPAATSPEPSPAASSGMSPAASAWANRVGGPEADGQQPGRAGAAGRAGSGAAPGHQPSQPAPASAWGNGWTTD